MTLIDFINCPRGLLIAPAGHGKTHAIATCIGMSKDDEVQLVLTHTHAGISSLKTKLQKQNIDNHKYHIETITGFAQRLVLAFCNKNTLPEQKEQLYFDAVIDKCTILLSLQSVRLVMSSSYKGLYVDEYQDCTVKQHAMIMKLADLMPVHILGDELQGIFDFADEKVDFSRALDDFIKFDILQMPWRWTLKGNCEALGQKIFNIRNSLLSNSTNFRLLQDENAHFYVYEHSSDSTEFYLRVTKLISSIKDTSVLVIFPSYKDSVTKQPKGNVRDRADMRNRMGLKYSYTLLEAIDAKDFYNCADAIDEMFVSMSKARKTNKKIYELLLKLTFNKTELDKWFDVIGSSDRIKKRNKEHRAASEKLANLCSQATITPCSETFRNVVSFFYDELNLRPKRPGLVQALNACLRNAVDNRKSVYDNMVEYKNRIRRNGRKIEGKCIGTTLLTKGLEFDTVVIIDAHRFTDKRNFYVAISRACKNLIIFTESKTINLV